MFCSNSLRKDIFIKLVRKFREMILRWERYRSIRSRMEDLFKLAKNAFSLDRLHRYTKKSVKIKLKSSLDWMSFYWGWLFQWELGRKKSCTGLFTCKFWEHLKIDPPCAGLPHLRSTRPRGRSTRKLFWIYHSKFSYATSSPSWISCYYCTYKLSKGSIAGLCEFIFYLWSLNCSNHV